MQISDLPVVNASLNAIAAVCLISGYVLIRQGHREMHQRFMLGALAASALFLTFYVIYHAKTGSRPFQGEGPIRLVYFLILVTHVTLAVVILPMALTTAARGWRSQLDRHVKIARWTLPLWLYVSVTGVVIYLMLYRFY